MIKFLRFPLTLALAFAAVCAFAVDIPYLTGRVTDNAQILSAEARESITARLKAHEEKTTNQIAVLTVPTLGGVNIEDYAASVFEAWKLGQMGKKNGILLLVAPLERRARIEVGYGLEGYINDGLAGGIIHNTLTPYFKKEDYDSGIEHSVREIIVLLEGGVPGADDSHPSAAVSGKSSFHLEAPDMTLTERILIGTFIFGILGLFTVLGILTPGVGWFLYLFLIPFWAMFPMVIVGSTGALYLLIAYVTGFPVLKLLLKDSIWYQKAGESLKTKGGASIGGFTATSGGSGRFGRSWSSGSSRGSGFSGGGGTSGGAGASGSW